MAIADTINSIRTHLETDYEALENIGAELENVDKNIENIASVVNGIYDNLPKTTGEDTNLSLTTLKGKMNTTLKGDTQQTQYSGINLLECKMPTTTALQGVTLTNNNDGTYTISGTNTSSSWVTFRLNQSSQIGTDNLQDYENGTYTLDKGTDNTNVQATLMQVDTWAQFIATGTDVRIKSQAITNATDTFIYIGIKANASFSAPITIKPMFLKGSYTTSTIPSFEPYVGGTASPNPSYPQNIEVVTGTQEVKVENVNLFNLTNNYGGTDNGITITKQDNGTYTFVGTATSTNINVWFHNNYLIYRDYTNFESLDKTKILLKLEVGSYRVRGCRIYYVHEDGTKGETPTIVADNDMTLTLSKVAYIVAVRASNAVNGTTYNETIHPMIYKGTTATLYTPHQEQTQTISLGDIELCKIGNYQDYLYKSNGKWYKKENIGKYICKSNDNWLTNAYGTNSWRLSTISPLVNDSVIAIMSTKFTGVAKNNRNTDNSVIYVDGNNLFTIRNTPYTTQALVQSGMANEPIYYIRDTSNDIEITNTSLISQLNNLEKLKSYNGITNINCSGNLSAILSVSALKGE